MELYIMATVWTLLSVKQIVQCYDRMVGVKQLSAENAVEIVERWK